MENSEKKINLWGISDVIKKKEKGTNIIGDYISIYSGRKK